MYLPKTRKDEGIKGGKKLRGISHNKIGVATAITKDTKASILIVANTHINYQRKAH